MKPTSRENAEARAATHTDPWPPWNHHRMNRTLHKDAGACAMNDERRS
jgi:hypothetical protein